MTNDTNTRYKINTRLYLLIKEDMLKYVKGQSEASDKSTIEVESSTAVVDLVKNNPETMIKFIVKDNETKLETKVNVKLYHTNQTIHLQGGKRTGRTTSTSLVADCLERLWIKILENNKDKIDKLNRLLITLDTKGVKDLRKGSFNKVSDQHPCDKCEYKTAHKFQLNSHKIRAHNEKAKPKPKLAKVLKQPNSYMLKHCTKSKGALLSSLETIKEGNEAKVDDSLVNKCKKCNICCNNLQDMNQHMELMHKEENKNDNTIWEKSPKKALCKASLNNAPIDKEAVDRILKEMSTGNVQQRSENFYRNNEITNEKEEEVEEFLDIEKERLHKELGECKAKIKDLEMDLVVERKICEKALMEKVHTL